MPEGAKAVMHHLKLDLVALSIALDCLRKTLPLIDKDQKLALLHAPFKGTTLFGGELAKLQEANTKHAVTFAVFPTPTAPPVSYSRPYVGRGKSLSDRKGPKKPRGWAGDRPLSLGLARLRKASQPVTASTPQASNKRKVEPWDDTSQTPRKNKMSFSREKSR